MTTKGRLEHLAQLADAATDGEWGRYYEGSGDFVVHAIRANDKPVARAYASDEDIVTVSGPDSCMFGGEQSERNADFIAAANPKTIKALLKLVAVQHEALQVYADHNYDRAQEGDMAALTKEAINEYNAFQRGE